MRPPVPEPPPSHQPSLHAPPSACPELTDAGPQQQQQQASPSRQERTHPLQPQAMPQH